jgi:hypothetical protein
MADLEAKAENAPSSVEKNLNGSLAYQRHNTGTSPSEDKNSFVCKQIQHGAGSFTRVRGHKVIEMKCYDCSAFSVRCSICLSTSLISFISVIHGYGHYLHGRCLNEKTKKMSVFLCVLIWAIA